MDRKRIYIASIVLFTISFSQNTKTLPNNVFANIRFVVAVPQGDFSDNVTNNGYGFDGDIGWYVYNGPIALGINIAGAQYGKSKRQIPYSYFSSLVTLTETTSSDIFIINPFIQPTLRFGDFSFYAKIFGGYQSLSTDTKILNEDQENNYNDDDDDDQPEYIAKSNVATDGSFNYGAGLGLRFPVYRGGENGPIYASLELKWSQGGEAEYLNPNKEGSIVLSDPSDGPVTTTLYPDKSKTDLFNISIGIGF